MHPIHNQNSAVFVIYLQFIIRNVSCSAMHIATLITLSAASVHCLLAPDYSSLYFDPLQSTEYWILLCFCYSISHVPCFFLLSLVVHIHLKVELFHTKNKIKRPQGLQLLLHSQLFILSSL